MNYLIDIILIAVFVFSIVYSAKKGLILAVTDIASFILGILGGKYLSERIAPVIYKNFIMNNVKVYLQTLFSTGALSKDSIREKFLSVFAFLPKNIYNTLQSSSMLSSDKFDLTNVTSVNSLEKNIIQPFVTSILKSTVYIILTVIIIIVIRVVAGFICKHFLPKLLKKVNSTAGGILGAVKGLLIVAVSANVLDIISITNKTFNGYVSGSVICSFISEHLNFMSMFIK